MKLVVSSKRMKSLTYSIVILLIVSGFLLGYFFYYIPRNTKTVQKNGFLILTSIAENIKKKHDGRLHFYKNIIQNENDEKKIATLLENNNIEGVQYKQIHPFPDIEPDLSPDSFLSKESVDSVHFDIDKENLVYTFLKKRKNTSSRIESIFSESIPHFLEPILSVQKKELFEYFALAETNQKRSKLVFHDKNFGIRSDFNPDTLLPKTVEAYVSGLQNLNSEYFNHKVFYYPFQLDTLQLVLFGFVRTDSYNAHISKIPFGFVYPLAIAFALLVVCLPILKFYIMDSNEQVRIRDIILFGLSIFTSVSVLTLVIIQYALWKGEEARALENLAKLSSQIEQSFLTELGEAFGRLDQLDKIPLSQDSVVKRRAHDRNRSNYTGSIIEHLQQNRPVSSYYPFDRVSWVDSAGEQTRKAELYGQPVFTNVKDRKYFKAFKDSSFLALRLDSTPPLDSVVNIGWEPIYSWTNADFNISMSKKAESGHLAVLATKMYSVVDVLMPVGYGFCVINNVGEVQLHSDLSRNLNENFFEKCQPSGKIQGMIAARQEGDANEVSLYGKSQMVAVRPLKNLPYSIITFYDKGYIVPVNMRILIFATGFSLLSGLINIFLLLLLSRIAFKHILVYSPMDFLNWLPPRRIHGKFYLLAFMALSFVILLLIFLTSLFNAYGTSNYTILAIGFMTPINVICGIYLLKSTFALKEIPPNVTPPETGRKSLFSMPPQFRVLLGNVSISLFVIFFSQTFKYPIHRLFFIFQILFVLFSIVVIRFSQIKRYVQNKWPDTVFFRKIQKQYRSIVAYSYENYRRLYNLMATCLVISISVMPTGLYVWYAHNQEIIQSVKKHQLHFANGISRRTDVLRNRAGTLDSVLISPAYLEQLISQKGIYTIHEDVFERLQDSPADSAQPIHKIDFENFYFDVADRVSNDYYNPQIFPSLREGAEDKGWFWEVKADEIILRYQAHNRVRESLQITSTMPERFRFIGFHKNQFWVVILITCLLLIALYSWLQSTTQSVFLWKYVTGNFGDCTAHLRSLLAPEGLPSGCLTETPNTYSVSSSNHDLNMYEKDLLQNVRTCKDVYKKIWEKSTEKERYLLFDFAYDGLINYKNTPEIYSLFSKGIFKIQNERVKLFNPAFRTYILTEIAPEEITGLQKKFQENSAWQAFRKPLVLSMGLVVVASVLFFTRAELFQQILAFSTGLTALIALIPKIFGTEKEKPKAE